VELYPEDVVRIRENVVVREERFVGSSSTVKQRSVYLDVELRDDDLSELARALLAARDDLSSERFGVRTRFVHEPVVLIDDKVLRIEWRGPGGRVVPSIDRAIEMLDARYDVVDSGQEDSLRTKSAAASIDTRA
jgi:hypothetical protein